MNDKKLSKKIQNFFTEYQTQNISKLIYTPKFELKGEFDGKLLDDWSDIIITDIKQIEFEVELREDEFHYFVEAFNKNFPDVEKYDWIKTKFEVLETFEIIPKDKCEKCNITIPVEKGQYYCYWCKISFCEKCIEDLNFEIGIAKLVHKEHNLVYFKTRNENYLKNLDLHKLGENLFTQRDENELDPQHEGECNGCNRGFRNFERYLCVSCLPGSIKGDGYVDYCFECIKVMRTPNENKEKYDKIANKFNEHVHENHVYLRLVFGENDYFEF
jgi:hypothetical protein